MLSRVRLTIGVEIWIEKIIRKDVVRKVVYGLLEGRNIVDGLILQTQMGLLELCVKRLEIFFEKVGAIKIVKALVSLKIGNRPSIALVHFEIQIRIDINHLCFESIERCAKRKEYLTAILNPTH